MGNLVEQPAMPARSYAKSGSRGVAVLSGVVALLLCSLILTSCGDVYRPVANPVLKPGGDPQPAHLALVISSNPGNSGMASVIDVSGDTNIGNFLVGHGAIQGTFSGGASRAFVVNKTDDTVSLFAPTVQGSVVTTISLPVGSAPVFVGGSETAFAYVANSGTNTIGVINVTQAIQQFSVPVGRTPVAVVETPDNTRLFSVNQGDGTVTALQVSTGTALATIPVGSFPVAAAVKSDGTALYVLNQGSATVSLIDVSSNTVTATLPTGPSPRFLTYDAHLKRLYVANSGSNTISVFDADVGLTPLATVAVGAAPVSIAALPDGTRVYVANSGCSDAVNLTGCSGTTVSVVDAVSLALRKTITVGSTPVCLATEPGSTKVVVANRDSNSISSIRTSDDTVANTNASGAPQPSFVVVSP